MNYKYQRQIFYLPHKLKLRDESWTIFRGNGYFLPLSKQRFPEEKQNQFLKERFHGMKMGYILDKQSNSNLLDFFHPLFLLSKMFSLPPRHPKYCLAVNGIWAYDGICQSWAIFILTMYRNEIILFLSLLTVLAVTEDCFGEKCAHISPTFANREASRKEISMAVEQEIRRQYWFYLNQAQKIYEAQLQIGGRIVFFYFHRNIVGTFFIVCSWYIEERYSEVNTFVRVGNGSPNGNNDEPMNIDPFIITISDSEQNTEEVTFQDGVITIGGEEVPVGQVENSCMNMSDEVLRKQYWYYLNGAELISKTAIAIPQRTYAVLTYMNIVGTFLVISSCEADQVTANTFVRLGKGSVNTSASVVIDPVILAINPL